MSITYDEDLNRFHLETVNTSYIMEIVDNRHLLHAYWGKRIHVSPRKGFTELFEAPSFSPNPDKNNKKISFDTMPREYPDYGRSDYGTPAVEIRSSDGSHIVETDYHSHRIIPGKTGPQSLPALYGLEDDKVKTLVITLRDNVINLKIELHYSVFEEYDVIARHAVICNEGTQPIELVRAESASVDFYGDRDFDVINLHGAWARERHLSRIPLGNHGHVIDSKRGASSHEQNPFLALLRRNTDEFTGDVYAFNLVYSGSFSAQVSVNSYGKTRMQIGLNPIDFQWHMEPGSSFYTPEAVLAYSDRGLNGMSAIFHRIYRERLCRGNWQYRERPVLINNWEATYYDFNEQKIRRIIEESSALGMELFVLDDGWFGKRDSDRSGLGDWFVNRDKLPGGLRKLSDYAASKGMMFGLWFEPEMVSRDSDLFRAHPDWCLGKKGRYSSEGRNQLVLDLGREEIREYLFKAISTILEEGRISYVKWDMNRNITEVGSAALPPERQLETSHRYMLGLYELLERLTAAFPGILFESCSGGGGRFDPGMLYYMPQTWTSDNTDSFERLRIQWGTSLLYPPVSMAAHVSASPNHQVGRATPLKTRGYAAMAANFGYELDIPALSPSEKEALREQILLYKKIRHTVQFGKFIRLLSPYDDRGTSWMFLSPSGNQIVFFFYGHLASPYKWSRKVKLSGLSPAGLYRTEEGAEYYGDELMHSGLDVPPMMKDFDSAMIILEARIPSEEPSDSSSC